MERIGYLKMVFKKITCHWNEVHNTFKTLSAADNLVRNVNGFWSYDSKNTSQILQLITKIPECIEIRIINEIVSFFHIFVFGNISRRIKPL